jgi:hypothetical protein
VSLVQKRIAIQTEQVSIRTKCILEMTGGLPDSLDWLVESGLYHPQI